MLTIKIPPTEKYNEETCKFEQVDEGLSLHLERSLLAMSKWESIWEVPFLEQDFAKLTREASDSFLKCMIIEDVDDDILNRIPDNEILRINEYVASKQTATTIREPKAPPGKKQIFTSELLYYNIFANQIPIEVENWHINRLLNLFAIFRIQNDKANPKKKKMTSAEINSYMDERDRINEERKKMLNTKG